MSLTHDLPRDFIMDCVSSAIITWAIRQSESRLPTTIDAFVDDQVKKLDLSKKQVEEVRAFIVANNQYFNLDIAPRNVVSLRK